MKKTQRIELVETGNIALSIKRMQHTNGDVDWRRALVHALGMSGLTFETQRKVRETLGLP